jgi:hypothetical protein
VAAPPVPIVVSCHFAFRYRADLADGQQKQAADQEEDEDRR